MSAIHSCPRCGLRFRLEAELTDHLVADHGREPEELAPDYHRAAERHHRRHAVTDGAARQPSVTGTPPEPAPEPAPEPSPEPAPEALSDERAPVVLATDGGTPARTAERLFTAISDPARLAVTVVGVVPPHATAAGAPDTGDATRAARGQTQRAVQQAAGRLGDAGFRVESLVVVGDPAGQIADVAQRLPARLLVMGARPWHDVGLDRLTGRRARDRAAPDTAAEADTAPATRRTTVSRRVMRNAGVPTLAVREFAVRRPADRMRILVGYDGSRAADAALDALVVLADPHRVGVTVVHVREPHRDVDVARSSEGTGRIVVGTRVTPADSPVMHAAHRQLHDPRVLPGASRRLTAAGFDVRTEALEGRAEELLVDRALEDPLDLVVLGSRGLGPLRRVLEGSVSDAMMRLAPATLVAPDPGAA